MLAATRVSAVRPPLEIPTFSAEYSDHSAMLRMHAGNGDMSDLGRRFVACFVAAADDAGLPDDPALRDALRDYMQWAVDDVMLQASGPGSEAFKGYLEESDVYRALVDAMAIAPVQD